MKESVRGERAQEQSKGALPPLIYLLFLAQTVHSKEDAPKSNSHSQRGSHLSKKVAKWEWPSSNHLHYRYQHFQQELWDPREPACANIWSAQAVWGRIFFSGFKKTTAMIYMQSTLRRPPSQPPAQITLFFLDENVDVSRGSIHLQRQLLLWGYISQKCFINCFFYPTSILSFFEMKVRFWSWARFLDSVEQKLSHLRRVLSSY